MKPVSYKANLPPERAPGWCLLIVEFGQFLVLVNVLFRNDRQQ